jgi:small-conductance mechanosensitive channel
VTVDERPLWKRLNRPKTIPQALVSLILIFVILFMAFSWQVGTSAAAVTAACGALGAAVGFVLIRHRP